MEAIETDAMDLQQAARMLKMHPDTVKKYAESGDIPGWKIGISWRFSRAELEKYLSGKVAVPA